MFTGLITAIGTIQRAVSTGDGLDLEIAVPWDDLTPGESVAVDGACLTVERIVPGGLTVHLVSTTLARTRFATAAVGDRCNLERALRVGDRLGGHLVQGHVDGVGTVQHLASRGDATLLDLAAPADVLAVSVPMGSITVDGVSLTVNALPGPGAIQVALIPFTLQHTTLGTRRPGDRVHLEGDVVGRYLRALAVPHLDRKAD